MATVGIAASAGAGVLQAGGQIAAGIQNDRIAKANAARLDASAADTLLAAQADGEVIRTQFGQLLGAQRAGLSAANVDISQGSAAALSVDTAGVGELEVLRTLTNAAREAYGLRTQAAFTRAEGTAARRAGFVNAAGTLLGTTGDTFGKIDARRRA